MAEACKVVSLGAPLCHEEACVRQGDDHSYAASISGVSSGSLCSSASDLSDHATSSPPDHSSEASSASPSTLQLDSEGPLYELSSLIAQLPVRRGLSKYYQGKSQSFTSISDATCVQDLAKKFTYSKDEDVQKLCSRIRHEPAVKSLTKAMQQDDSEEALKRFICLSIVESKQHQPLVQRCQTTCTPEQESCTNAHEFSTT